MHSGPQRRNPEISVEVGPDAVLKLAQTRSKGSSTGWLVWPVAIDFCKFLLSHPELVRHKRVLELGAGTGAVGLTCGFIGSSSVSISDLEECLPILQSNLDLNSDLVNPSSKITIDEIRWGCDAQLDRVLQVHGTFDVIVGSDIIFHQPEAVLAALVNTISSASTPETKVLIAYEDRAGMVEDEEFFFGPMRSRFSSLEAIDLGGDRSLFIFSDLGIDNHLCSHNIVDHHSTTSFESENPIANEHVIFLPGGKVMVVDYGIQSFAKNVVSVAIAGIVAAGAAVGVVLWADARVKRRNAVTVQRSGGPGPSAPPAESGSEDEEEEEEDEEEAE